MEQQSKKTDGSFLEEMKRRINNFLHDKELKRKLYVVIFESDTPKGKLFDVFLIVFILLSVMVAILESLQSVSSLHRIGFKILEYIFTAFFTFEYLTRIYCSPKPRKYIFSFFGIIDLLATLPLYLSFFFSGARYFLILRAFRLIRVFRIFKLFNFLKEGNLLLRSLKASAPKIFVFFLFILILVTSLGTLMYMIEGTIPGTSFNNIPNSIYWAIVTMTTVGYGDITPVTPLGKLLSACVMLIGYTIIAVPTGIVSANIMREHHKLMMEECPHCHRTGNDEASVYCKYCGGLLEEE